MLSRNAPLLYVQQQGGWRSAGILLRVYARWLPQEAPAMPVSAPVRTPAAPETSRAMAVGESNYLKTQNPCDSIPRGTLVGAA